MAEHRVWQVEWMSRPDEMEHIKHLDCLRKACALAREMSDKHDGTAVVMALDPMPEGQSGQMVTGHMEFVFGILSERAGSLENVKPPSSLR